MTGKAGQSLSTQDIEALEQDAVVDEVEDVDVADFIAEQTRKGQATDAVVIDGQRLKIAAITDEEDNKLLKEARRPDKRNGKVEMKLNYLEYRKAMIALSLSKASGAQVFPAQLSGWPSGTLNKLQSEIMKLSGAELPEQAQTDPFDFLS